MRLPIVTPRESECQDFPPKELSQIDTPAEFEQVT
jgi:hypothetical protein